MFLLFNNIINNKNFCYSKFPLIFSMGDLYINMQIPTYVNVYSEMNNSMDLYRLSYIYYVYDIHLQGHIYKPFYVYVMSIPL